METIEILTASRLHADCPVDEMATRLAALSHPARLRILKHLAGRGACCCGEVVDQLDLAQSTVSQHLKVLVEAGLVTYSPERPRSRYAVDKAEVERFSKAVSTYLAACAAPGCCG